MQNGGRSGAILTPPPNELVFTFEGSYICANFGENRSRNATLRVPTDGHTEEKTENYHKYQTHYRQAQVYIT